MRSMSLYKILGYFIIVIAVMGFGLAIYEYSLNRGKIPTILYSISLLLIGFSLLRYKKKLNA